MRIRKAYVIYAYVSMLPRLNCRIVALPATLYDLGFDLLLFAHPRQVREPLASIEGSGCSDTPRDAFVSGEAVAIAAVYVKQVSHSKVIHVAVL
ncbi:hypothetical protein NDU88_002999 [Pleurodeles waltl]|uniref:Uncharacterized protein n=1 Tax=Pleurodeles waltl TaxID=8319 RepID=A0AAV7QAI2_PLEWA|nr:hypothetical protein NDU88_002999 [Pleurodeles waltl]